jgi:hypothetical protein
VAAAVVVEPVRQRGNIPPAVNARGAHAPESTPAAYKSDKRGKRRFFTLAFAILAPCAPAAESFLPKQLSPFGALLLLPVLRPSPLRPPAWRPNRLSEGPIRQTREGGNEWEPIKILLEGDRNSNKMNTASNTRLRLTTKVGQAHVATGVPLDIGTNTPPSDPRNAAEKPSLESTDPHRSDR